MAGRLVALDLHHAEALETFLVDFDADPSELHAYFCDRNATIETAARELQDWADGAGLKDGWVPCSTWFWEEDDVLKGVINVRHRLTPALEKQGGHIGYAVAPSFRRQGIATRMLEAVLEPCRELGITRALLTCDSDNPGSCRTIERNGGILDREAWMPEHDRSGRWYWIDLGD